MKCKNYRVLQVAAASLFLTISSACTEEKKTESAPAAGATATQLPPEFAVEGSLAVGQSIDTSAGSTLSLSNRPVALVDDSGATVAEGVTKDGGTFSLQISSGASLRLAGTENSAATGNSNRVPSVLKVKSLFEKDDSSTSDVVGVQSTISLDPAQVNNGVLNTGSFGVAKVGAIAGKLSLETNESPVGIEIYRS
jgi:hypothetical protein